LHQIDLFAWLDHFLRLQTADTLEMYLCASLGLVVLGPFAAMAYYHFFPGAVRRLPTVQWAVLILVTTAWLLSTSDAFGPLLDRLLPVAPPERARFTWAMAFATFLLFAQLRLMGVPRAGDEPEPRRRTRVSSF